MFFNPSNERPISLTIVHKIADVATDFIHNSISLFRRLLILGFSELLGNATCRFEAHFNIFFL